MKLWHVSQTVNNHYDTFFVCAAETEEAARDTWPRVADFGKNITVRELEAKSDADGDYWLLTAWCEFKHTTATLLGEAVPGTVAGVICSSFHAG